VGDALPLLARLKLDCMLLELRPTDGYAPELVEQVLRAEPNIMLVLFAEQEDPRTAVLCLHAGAADYLIGSADPLAIIRSLESAQERQAAQVAASMATAAVRDEVALMAASLKREQERVKHLAVATLDALVCVVEAKDAWLAGHSVRVAELAACLAAEQGRTDVEIETVRLAGRVHDIGMISVGDGILSKEGPLTAEEFEQVKQHVVIGSQILAPLPQLGLISTFVRHHHERWDGKGYPDGLVGEAIPWGARLIAAAEIYDALTTSRPYRETLSPEDAVRQMEQLIDTIVSPAVYDALRTVVQRRRALVFVSDASAPRVLAGTEFRDTELTTPIPPIARPA
jgi:putative two-component system response regulator